MGEQSDVTVFSPVSSVDHLSPSSSTSCFDFDPRDLSEKELESLAAAVSVYVHVFAELPFSEQWSVDKGQKDLSSQLNIGETQFDMNNIEHKYKLIEHIVKNPDTVKTIHEENNQKLLLNEGSITVNTVYPLEYILEAYAREMKDPSSLVLVRYQNDSGQEKTVDLTTKKIEDQIKRPTGVTRIRNIEPENDGTVNEAIIDEVGYFLSPEDQEDLKSKLMPIRTIYLGEIAKVKESSGWMSKSMLEAFKRYRRDLPDQILLFTKVGSSILKEEGAKNDRMMGILTQFFYPGKKVNQIQKQYPSTKGGSIVINLYQVGNGDA